MHIRSHDIKFMPDPVQIFVKHFLLEATNTSVLTVLGTPWILRLFPKLSFLFRSFYKLLLTVNCQKVLRQLKVAPFRLFLSL